MRYTLEEKIELSLEREREVLKIQDVNLRNRSVESERAYRQALSDISYIDASLLCWNI